MTSSPSGKTWSPCVWKVVFNSLVDPVPLDPEAEEEADDEAAYFSFLTAIPLVPFRPLPF